MYRKNCERCGRPSFSSCSTGAWYCPVCGHDLSSYPTFQAEIFERIQRNLPEIIMKMRKYNSSPH